MDQTDKQEIDTTNRQQIHTTSKRQNLNKVDPEKLFKVVKELIFQLIESLQQLFWTYLIQIVTFITTWMDVHKSILDESTKGIT